MARRYYKGLQLDQIRSFCSLARLGSFVAVAAEVGLSVPSVWRQVRALERECGVRLLSRKGRSVHLTTEGREALALFEPHLIGIESAREVVKQRVAEAPRQLTIAAPAMLLNDYLPEPLRRFVAAEPRVLLSLINEPSDVSRRAVQNNEADVGIVTYLPEEASDPQVQYEDLLQLPWLLATGRGHPLSRRRSLKLTDLLSWPWILPASETQPRRRLEAALRREGIRDQVRVVMESRTFALTETYVKMGLGITFIYGRDPKHPPPGLWLRPLPQWFGYMPVAIVTRTGRHHPPHVKTFLDIVRKVLGAK